MKINEPWKIDLGAKPPPHLANIIASMDCEYRRFLYFEYKRLDTYSELEVEDDGFIYGELPKNFSGVIGNPIYVECEGNYTSKLFLFPGNTINVRSQLGPLWTKKVIRWSLLPPSLVTHRNRECEWGDCRDFHLYYVMKKLSNQKRTYFIDRRILCQMNNDMEHVKKELKATFQSLWKKESTTISPLDIKQKILPKLSQLNIKSLNLTQSQLTQ